MKGRILNIMPAKEGQVYVDYYEFFEDKDGKMFFEKTKAAKTEVTIPVIDIIEGWALMENRGGERNRWICPLRREHDTMHPIEDCSVYENLRMAVRCLSREDDVDKVGVWEEEILKVYKVKKAKKLEDACVPTEWIH